MSLFFFILISIIFLEYDLFLLVITSTIMIGSTDPLVIQIQFEGVSKIIQQQMESFVQAMAEYLYGLRHITDNNKLWSMALKEALKFVKSTSSLGPGL